MEPERYESDRGLLGLAEYNVLDVQGNPWKPSHTWTVGLVWVLFPIWLEMDSILGKKKEKKRKKKPLDSCKCDRNEYNTDQMKEKRERTPVK